MGFMAYLLGKCNRVDAVLNNRNSYFSKQDSLAKTDRLVSSSDIISYG